MHQAGRLRPPRSFFGLLPANRSDDLGGLRAAENKSEWRGTILSLSAEAAPGTLSVMCGRFTLSVNPEAVALAFDLDAIPDLAPRYNIAPTQTAAVVRLSLGDEARVLELMRWGLVPFWAKDPKIGNRMINARAETAASKPSFRTAFKSRRCLVPADGFYEWRREQADGPKQPYRICLKDGGPFAMAGLWESWRPKDESGGDDKDEAGGSAEELRTFTILTTIPNDLVSEIHDRMPVILGPSEYDAWLDPEVEGGDDLDGLLDAFPADRMTIYPVSTLVNSPRNDVPECIARLS